MEYNFKQIEKKWQDYWYANNTFAAKQDFSLPKYYCLVEFPYPSGQGLHVGHPRSYTALDIVARKKRMQGYNVLYPMGWDAFGLPTENYAIKNHIHPKIVTKNNIAHFKQQLQSLGFCFDWTERSIPPIRILPLDPVDLPPTVQSGSGLQEGNGRSTGVLPVRCVLANEEVVNGVCERCGSQVVRKVKSQWMLKITAYARQAGGRFGWTWTILIVSKLQQKNWIGRSTGAEVDFLTKTGDT